MKVRAGRNAWRVAGDAGLAVACALVIGFWASRIAESWGAKYAVADVAASAAMAVLALLRRRNRAWSAIGGLVVAAGTIAAARLAVLPSEPGPGLVLALAVLVGSAVAALPVRPAAVVAAGGAAVVAGSLLTRHVFGLPPVFVLNAAGWLVAVGYGTGVRLIAARRRATAARVRDEERRRLARELHDVVGHHLTRIVLQSQAAQILTRDAAAPDAAGASFRVPADVVPAASASAEPASGPVGRAPAGGGSVPTGVDALAGIEAAGTEALGALRRVVGLLRDGRDSDPVAVSRLADLVAAFDGPVVRLELADDEEAWPPDVGATVYRVVQEALTNVARHAPDARSVTVGVTRSGGTLAVEVTDDAPPDRPRRTGYGLAGMRERVEALGGTVRAGPRAAGGWTVRATLPVRDGR